MCLWLFSGVFFSVQITLLLIAGSDLPFFYYYFPLCAVQVETMDVYVSVGRILPIPTVREGFKFVVSYSGLFFSGSGKVKRRDGEEGRVYDVKEEEIEEWSGRVGL